MTNIDIYVIINKNKHTAGQAKGIIGEFISDEACVGSKKMTELHNDLKKIADYFIELFKITGGKYSCSRTKLGKLISIVAFVYAVRGEKLIDEKIYKYKSDSLDKFCGTTIQELILLVGRDAYIQKEYDKDNNSRIPLDDLQGQEKISTPLSKDLRAHIEDVFLNFGAYEPKELGNCINPIILCESVILEDDSIDIQELNRLSKKDFEDFNYNSNFSNIRKDLVNYLFPSPPDSREGINNG